MNRIAIFHVALAAFTAPVAAQSVIVRVVDEPTRLGIGFVEVTLLRDDRTLATALTDTLGFFKLSIPGPGKYVMRLRALGYVEQMADLDLSERVPSTWIPTAKR
jgi:hypothetical protein